MIIIAIFVVDTIVLGWDALLRWNRGAHWKSAIISINLVLPNFSLEFAGEFNWMIDAYYDVILR